MSTFYLLPPRPLLAEQVRGFLHAVLPGLDWDEAARGLLPDLIGAAAGACPDVYVVYREELPDGEPPARALVNGFGAEPGDQVIEVRPGGRPGELTARRWHVGAL